MRRISRVPFVGQPEADASPILGRPHPLEQPCALEAVDVAGERRRRDSFLGRELGERETGAPLDEPEQRRLTCGDAELLGLLAQLAGEAKENGSQVGCDLLRIKHNVANH